MRYGLIVLVLGTVAACTSDPKPDPTDTPSTPPTTAVSTTATPTPTTTPTPSVATTGPNVRPGETVPVLPALAKTNSRPGAAAFAYYWFRALDWGYATTDSTLAKTLYLPQCTDCARFMTNYDDAKSKGQHFIGGRSNLTSRRIVDDDKRHPGATVVDVRLSVAALKVVNSAGKTVDTAPAIPRLDYRIWLSWAQARWVLVDTKEINFRYTDNGKEAAGAKV